MAANSNPESQSAKRTWVVVLYFYLAALVGLGFVVTGTTMALFGAKNALFPGLGLSRYSYEYDVSQGSRELTEEQLRTAKNRAIEDRRGSGLDGMINGLIIAGVGAPVLVWHLKRGRALNSGTDRPDGTTPTPPPSLPQPPAAS